MIRTCRTASTRWLYAVTRIGSYDEDEVRVLVEEYEELKGGRSRAYVHVRLMDLDRALSQLPLTLRKVVLVHGQLGVSTRSAGKVLGMGTTSVHRRYHEGLAHLLKTLNGGR